MASKSREVETKDSEKRSSLKMKNHFQRAAAAAAAKQSSSSTTAAATAAGKGNLHQILVKHNLNEIKEF